MTVREWFAGKEVLLTGVTSDIGNAVLDKLLRCCPDIKTIYVVLRSKNMLTHNMRIESIFESAGFERVKQEVPYAMSRIKILEGNLVYDSIGLNEKQVALLRNVSVVIHAAGPYETLLELCRELPALCVAAVAESVFKQTVPIVGSVEHKKMPKIPLALIRIPAVGPAFEEPMPGYVTVHGGISALMVGAGYALGNAALPAALIPVDMAANVLIIVAWNGGMRNQMREATTFNVPALNCTWDTLIKSGSIAREKFSYPSFGIRGMTSYLWLYWLIVLILEWLPSVLCDALLSAVGRKPSIVDDHHRVRKMLQSLQPVLSKSWIDSRNNVYDLHNLLTPKDKVEFFVSADIDLETYALCTAAAVKKTRAYEKNAKIIANFKRMMFAIIALIICSMFFLR